MVGTAFFHSFLPLNVGPALRQKDGLRWLMEALRRSRSDAAAALGLYEQFLSSEHVDTRHTCVGDYAHTDWEQMELYSPEWGTDWASPPLEKRMEIFRRVTDRLAEEAFDEGASAPDSLIQVSCTGYDSPTASQKLISRRGWGERTKTFHLGHMGCYAALPASFLAAELAQGSNRTSVFLTELCTLHLRPGGMELQQVVMNTLFADGAIRFDVSRERVGNSFALLRYHETVLPETELEMTWTLKNSAFAMTLSRAVPIHIARTIESFVENFLRPAEMRAGDIDLYAIHPGGPKIIELIAERLELPPEKVRHCKKVFRERGNMSSCTVPHVWDEILNDPLVPHGALVVSLAFGPGLTIAANLLRKETR